MHGEKFAIVGGNGSGTSTLFKLLLGFYHNYEGDIVVNGRDIATMSGPEVAKLISYIPQNGFIFKGTIMENIKFGNETASEHEVHELCRHLDITNQPDGYNADIGENGILFSDGQKQRILLARVLLTKTPIIFMDEATSAVDAQSEELLIDAMNDLLKDQTIVIITHHLSTLEKCDRVVVLHNGTVAELGTKDELLKKNSNFANLFRGQHF